MKLLSTTLLLSMALGAAACSKPGSDAAAPSASATANAASAAPLATASGGAGADMSSFTGTVLETMNSGGYTYIRLKSGAGEQWAAVPQASVTVGSTVTVTNATMMDSFTSNTLGRTFSRILFGTLGGAPSASPPAAPAAATAASNTPVPKATGPDGHTVAEVITGKDALKDKPVTVHARVAKVNNGIMGKNWLHLQDGSGSGPSDNDLLATSSDTAVVGQIVTVKGIVRLNRDFGAGYAYPVLIEEASVAAK